MTYNRVNLHDCNVILSEHIYHTNIIQFFLSDLVRLSSLIHINGLQIPVGGVSMSTKILNVCMQLFIIAKSGFNWCH